MIFAQGFGADRLVSNAYRLSYLQDAQTAPDGGFPTYGDGLPPSDPGNKLRQDLKTNDLRNWTPVAPGAETVLDVESDAAFTAAKDAVRLQAVLAGAADGGDLAVLDAYHATLVPPFCLKAVQGFFDSH